MEKVLIKGTKTKSFTGEKTFELKEFKAVETNDGALEISGYANTKYVADRYGDVPTEYNRDFVYDLTEFKKNPIMLLNHDNDVKSVAGSYVEFREDEKGLFVRGVFTKSNLPVMEHVRTLIKEGHLKTFSIAGQFLYENPDNYNLLTLAKIYEISIVAVPADPNATFRPTNEGKAAEESKKDEKPAQVKEEVKIEEKKQEEKEINFKPLAEKITLFEIKQKIQKARNIGRGAK